MAGIAFIGQAGTGKTTKVIRMLDELIDFDSWPSSASILAITFMHGSRRRLDDKLKAFQRKGIQVNCKTIDSFCLNLLQRYKTYLRLSYSIVVVDNPNEFTEIENKYLIGRNKIRQFANELLDFKIVREVLGFSYPIIIVDEFQDCDEQLVDIVKKLNDCSQLIVAADEFQNLSGTNDCLATEWITSSLDCNILEKIWRTDENKILESSRALRTNKSTNNGVDIKFVQSKDLAAFTILSNMQWYDRMGCFGRSVAIISPVGPSGDTFVHQTLERIRFPMERKGSKPYKLNSMSYFQEGHKNVTVQNILESFKEWASIEVVTHEQLDLWKFDDHLGFKYSVNRAKRLMKLRNVNYITKNEFIGLLSSGIHFVNTYLFKKGDTRIFLTIHGAKNREFDDVFILWPKYTLPKGDLYLRKLLYNAITRAKRKVVIIVQGSSERSGECPLNLLIQ